MNEIMKEVTFEQFKGIIDIVNQCMDDYLYIMDLQKGIYCISKNAAERFKLPSDRFDNAPVQFIQFVYPEDLNLLNQDMEQIVLHGKDFHNLQYRGSAGRGVPSGLTAGDACPAMRLDTQNS